MVVEAVTRITAPIAVCFDLARDIDLHVKSMVDSHERVVSGKTAGLIGLDEEVTWEAKHLGFNQRFTSRITAFDPPTYFRDEMIRGAFKSFVHHHYFQEQPGTTTMRDVLEFESPFWILGRAVDNLFMAGYLRRLVSIRAGTIKRSAESL